MGKYCCSCSKDDLQLSKYQISQPMSESNRVEHIFELSFPNEEQAKIAMNKAIQKLPIRARIITRDEEI